MSLIQEALRRQQEEAGEIEPQATPPVQEPSAKWPAPASQPPAVVPPTPAPGGPPPLALSVAPQPSDQDSPPSLAGVAVERVAPDKQKSPVVMLAAVVVGILLLAAVGIWAAMYLFNEAESGVQAAATADVEGQPAGAGQASSDATKVADTTPIEAVKEVAPVVVEATASSPADNYDYGEEKEEEKVVPPVSDVVWPALTLSGVVGKGANGSVILNNEIVGVGEYIEGVKVVSIGHREVTLEFEGRQQTVKQGNSTQ